jgi:hypothetical protein
MSSSAPSMPRQSAPVKIFLVVILGLGGALAGVMFFGPGGGIAATRAGILPGASAAAGEGEVPAQPLLGHDTTVAGMGTTGLGRSTTGTPLVQNGQQGTTGQYQQAQLALAQPAGAAGQPAPQGAAAGQPSASQQGLNPFLVPGAREPSVPTANAGMGSAALAPAAAYPAAAPTSPSDNPGVPSGISGAQNFPALPLPLPQPAAPLGPFGLRCGDIPWDEGSMRMGLMAIGAMVLQVSAGSEGALAGLNVGDRIVRAGGQPVVSAPQFLFLTTQHKGGPLDVEVIRGGVLYRTTLGNNAPR